MLTSGGFRLPGEAQMIERIVIAFAETYWNDNRASGLFSNPDVVMVLAFSAIMLNTDAHNPNVKPERKMTRVQFIANNRGIDDGKDLPEPMLTELYDSIVANPIKMPIGVGASMLGWQVVAGEGGAEGWPDTHSPPLTPPPDKAADDARQRHTRRLAGTDPRADAATFEKEMTSAVRAGKALLRGEVRVGCDLGQGRSLRLG